jgi:hypothetical protein
MMVRCFGGVECSAKIAMRVLFDASATMGLLRDLVVRRRIFLETRVCEILLIIQQAMRRISRAQQPAWRRKPQFLDRSQYSFRQGPATQDACCRSIGSGRLLFFGSDLLLTCPGHARAQRIGLVSAGQSRATRQDSTASFASTREASGARPDRSRDGPALNRDAARTLGRKSRNLPAAAGGRTDTPGN